MLKPKYIRDPDAKRPPSYDDEEAMKKLEQEPKFIVDVNISKPYDWNETIDGEYKTPMINNPNYISPE